ncbi:MAG TPA: NAD+ synthase [bacterium]|nr:NAD+ synthase [bacterium]HPN31304.1 NAD+ synthase [bacterium]
MKVLNEIIKWLKFKLKNSGMKGFAIGLSGGVDSAVVAAIASSASKNIFGLIMPCLSNSEDAEHAVRFAKKFKIKYQILDLSPVYETYLKILPKADKLTAANLKSRLRMCALYHFAGLKKLMVLGTGNKSECSIGYFTKYGDGGSDLLPIADFYKWEVYDLANYLKINEEIINKPPSAGLWQGQTDEAEMGISYNELDAILEAIEKKKKLTGFDKSKVIKIKSMIEKSEHKRGTSEIFKKRELS